ncbi:MAG: hypothetical protein WAL95_01660 [Candidatus Acidiferrales bacterium]
MVAINDSPASSPTNSETICSAASRLAGFGTRDRRERIALLGMGAGHARVGSGSSRRGIVFSAAMFRMSHMGETLFNLSLHLRLSLLRVLEFHDPEQRRIERISVPRAQKVVRQRRPSTRIPAIRKSRTYESNAMFHQKIGRGAARSCSYI